MNWRIVEGNVSAQFFTKIHFTLANCSCYFIYLVEYCVWELKNESTRKIKIQFSININHLTSFIQHSRLHPEFKSFERNRRWIIDHLWRFAFCGLAFYATKNWPIFFINLMINLRCKIRFYHFLAWCEDFRNKKERITSIRTNIVRTTWKDAVSLEANLKIHFFFRIIQMHNKQKKVHKVKEPKMKRKQKDKIDSSVGHQSIEAVLRSNVSSCIIQCNGDFYGFENCLLCQSLCLFLLETYRPRKKCNQLLVHIDWLDQAKNVL